MAHFLVTIESDRGNGSAKSGDKMLNTHARGWHVGARVDLSINADGKDVVTLYSTEGSNGGQGGDKIIGTIVEGKDFQECPF